MKNRIILSAILLISNLSLAQWFPQNSGINGWLLDMSFIDSNTGWISADEGRVLKTTNGGINWNTLPTGSSSHLTHIQFVNSTTGWVTASNFKLLKTTDGGSAWTSGDLPHPSATNIISYSNMFFLDQNIGYIAVNVGPGGFSSTDAFIYKTTDGGSTWNAAYSFMDEEVNYLTFTDINTGWVSGTTVSKTTDGGSNWMGHASGGPTRHFKSIFFVDNLTGWFIMAEPGGWPYARQIVKTTDGGETWFPVFTDSVKDYVSLFFLDQNNGWCGGYDGVILHTTDGGNSWTPQYTGYPAAFGLFFTTPDIGWAAAGNILLHTKNGGTPVELTSFSAVYDGNKIVLNWSTATELNNKGFEIERLIPGNSLWETISFVRGYGTTNEIQSYSFADKIAGPGDIQYRLKQIDYDGSFSYSDIVKVTITNIGEGNSSPEKFILSQNYPNPFNPLTIISFGIKEKSNVKLSVLNSLGEEVSVLVDEVKEHGYYTASFNGSGFSSGVYFCKLQAGADVRMIKMILIK